MSVSLVQVEMERSYLTAEVFREILQQNGRSGENGDIIRTLSGRQVQLASQLPVTAALLLCMPAAERPRAESSHRWSLACRCQM